MNTNTTNNIKDQQLIDLIAVSIYLKDLQGVYIICNQYTLDVVGFSHRDQIIGKTDYELPWSAQADTITATDRAVIQANKEFRVEEQPEICSGHFKTFLSTKSPFRDSQSNIIGIIGLSIDITEQKKIREMLALTENLLEKSSTIKERFLSNTSHEIRNPLQSLVMIAEVLSQSWDTFNDTKRKILIDSVALSARRLVTFTTDTFDLSDLITQDKSLKIGTYNFSRLVEMIVADFNETSKLDKKAQIILNYNEEYLIAFDKDKITQVLHNILMNSLKWTQPDGTITVEISKAGFPNSTEVGIQCSVIDTGIGIPKEELEFIFEPFTESSRTASQACGTGLGLALCREIIKIHDGKIWASGNLEQGSVISFILPNSISKDNLYRI